MINFTPAQKRAIETPDKSLTVAAGAGSGKTAVLTERIVRHLLAGVDIGSILVVTFTKAAAADLKSKLYRRLLDQIMETPDGHRLEELLLRIPAARICTITSFCLDIVRSNFSVLGLSPSLRVADETEAGMILSKCQKALTDNLLKNDHAMIATLLDSFAGEKSFMPFDRMVSDIYSNLRAEPFWKQNLKQALISAKEECADITSKGFFQAAIGNDFKACVSDIIEQYNTHLDELCKYAYPDDNASSAVKDIYNKLIMMFIEPDWTDTMDYGELRDIICGLSLPRMSYRQVGDHEKEAAKEERNHTNSLLNRLKELFAFSQQEIVDDYMANNALFEALCGYIFALDAAYDAEKRRRSICDFADAEQYALTLLAQKSSSGVVRTQFCKQLRDSLKEVYVDEYQDVNSLQHLIFELLSPETNCFVVGDVKQSIYRFRNAVPDIFNRLIATPATEKRETVFLKENFRSAKPVIDFINIVFSKLYTNENVQTDYSNEKLVFSAECPETARVSVTAFYDGEVKTRLTSEAEAEYIACKISALLASGVPSGSIAILMRSIKNAKEIERALKKYGIPYESASKTGYLMRPEILLAVSVLKAMDNPNDDLSLAATMRSPIYGFTAEELFRIRRFYSYDTLFECVVGCKNDYIRKYQKKRYTADRDCKTVKIHPFHCRLKGKRTASRPDKSTLLKAYTLWQSLSELRSYSREESCSGSIWEMYRRTNLLALAASDSFGEERKKALIDLYKFALGYEKTSFRGLETFLVYLSEADERFTPDGEAGSVDSVRIMSIHKSKGLEFDYCFLANSGKRINMSDINAGYIKRKDSYYTFNMRSRDSMTEYVPLIKALAAKNERQETVKEELRCLYVALTRAKKQLFITGSIKSQEQPVKSGLFECSSMLDMLFLALESKPEESFVVSFYDTEVFFSPSDFTVKNKDDEAGTDVDTSLLTYEYPHCHSSAIPQKTAVSELRLGLLEDEEYSRTVSESDALRLPSFAAEQKGSMVGDATHLFMQFCDFSAVIKEGVKKEASRLCERKILLPKQLGLINYPALFTFFNSELFSRMISSPLLFREKRFSLPDSSNILDSRTDEKILVQGVVDCFFQNPDGSFTVLDYKTDFIKPGEEEKLIKRHKTQLLYYCKAVSQMTDSPVTKAILYSFALNKEIEVPVVL